MKTAISIPDDVFEEGEKLAKRLGLSRSQVYVEALRRMVKAMGHVHIRETLDRIYSVEDSRLDPGLDRAQAITLSREKW